MQYIGTGINDSATIVMNTADELEKSRALAVKFDANGKAVLCGAGENAIGILVADTNEKVDADEQVSVQVKEMGRWVAGGEVIPGDELTSDASGRAVKAASGDFIIAVALSAAVEEGTILKVQIVKAGYKPA